jgi:hypothetical protein
VGEPGGKIALGRLSGMREDNIKIDIRETGLTGVD